MSLSNVLSKINEAKVYANEDLSQGPLETLTGRRGRKNQAIETLKRLKEEYGQLLLRSSLFILVTGGAKDDFCKVASEKFECFTSDADDLYRNLADRVHPTLYQGKESAASLFDTVGRHLEDLAGELNVLEYPQLQFKGEYRKPINTKEDFVQLLKTAINDQVGGELVAVMATRSLVDRAIEKEHKAQITPIVLNVSDEKLALDLVPALERLTSRVFLVAAGKASKALKSAEGTVVVKEATEETVEQALTAIRSNLKK